MNHQDTKSTKSNSSLEEFAPIPAELDRIGKEIVDACFQIHSNLGAGLLESAYRALLTHEIRKRGFSVQVEVPVPILYDGVYIETGFRIDMLIEGCIIIELKATTDDHPIFKAQLLTYLKLTGNRLGFLVNFNKKLIKDGIQRIAL
jgi:GxxExxY protein